MQKRMHLLLKLALIPLSRIEFLELACLYRLLSLVTLGVCKSVNFSCHSVCLLLYWQALFTQLLDLEKGLYLLAHFTASLRTHRLSSLK